MARWLLPGGLRAQVTLAIALITALAIGLSLVAVYRGTGTRLRDRIDAELTTQVAEWDRLRGTADLSTPAALTRMAERLLAAQRYHPAARIFVIDVAGAAPVTNQPDVLAGEAERERQEGRPRSAGDGRGALPAPAGLATVDVAEAGRLRVLTDPISAHGRRVGTLQIADPLRSVEDAQDSLLRTFALVGSLAVLLAVLAGLTIATLIARPVRRLADVAAAVDTGDLSPRAGEIGARGELGILAGAFDRMLARLERAFARQRDFVSDASHELRTPLAVLRAQVEVLDRDADDPDHHEATATLLRRLDEMDRLITDMLTLASAESGRLVEPAPIDLGDYFEDLRRDLPLFGDRDFRVEPVDGVLVADAGRLTQVLRNLVRNAVVHTGVGDRITVAATVRGERLEIAISDTGPGIAPEHLDHIFERFYRVQGGRSRDSGGSGLGLAIAQAIVVAHEGRLWAESAVGAGTTMHVELPGYRPPAG